VVAGSIIRDAGCGFSVAVGNQYVFSCVLYLGRGCHKQVNAMDFAKKPSTRGFASMDPEKQRAIARKGGESVPNEKRSFSQNPSLAAEAGRKGGHSVNPTKRSFSQNHMLASEAGRKGGHASHGVVRKSDESDV
jgi:general stress protein YciG